MRLSLILWTTSRLPKSYSNFPERYIKKQTQFIEWQTPKLPQYQRRTVRFRKHSQTLYGLERCWTDEFQNLNAPHIKLPRVYVEPIKDFYIYRGDRVEILVGKDKGKHGIVNYVVTERNWVCVEGLNLRYTVQGKTESYHGVMIATEKPLLVPRDVALVDPSDHKPTRIEWRFDEEGNRVRVSLRSGRIIPIPTAAEETRDYKSKEVYLEQSKDTTAEHMKKTTFVPKCMTFEMEIMEQMGIKEDRIPYNMYWY